MESLKGLVRKLKPGEHIDLIDGGRVINIGKYNCTVKVIKQKTLEECENQNQNGEENVETN